MTHQSVAKSIEELKNNLIKIVEEKETEIEPESITQEKDFSEPVILSNEVVEKQKEDILACGKKPRNLRKRKQIQMSKTDTLKIRKGLLGELKLLDVTSSAFVDSRIEVLYSDHDNEEKIVGS